MILTSSELIRLLRSAVNVQQEESEVIDPAYLVMSDDDLMLFIKLGISRAFPSVVSLADLPDGSEYPILLLARIELYTKLAVSKADKVDMGVDNNNYIRQDQRFQHYMKLVESAKAQYESWLENEGQGEVYSHDVLLDSRHYERRNYEKQEKPKVRISIDNVTDTEFDMKWTMTSSSHFSRYEVYICDHAIINYYGDGSSYKDKMYDGAMHILTTHDIKNTVKHLSNLAPDKNYWVAVFSIERNQVWGYDEVSFHTQPVFLEPDMSIDSLPETEV